MARLGARAFLLGLGVDLESGQQTKTGKTALEFFTSAKPMRLTRGRSDEMTIGPVNCSVLGFDKPDFRGEIIDELAQLRESDTVRVIDALVVFKDAERRRRAEGQSALKDRRRSSARWSVVGSGPGGRGSGEEGMEASATAGAGAAAGERRRVRRRRAWDVLESSRTMLPLRAAHPCSSTGGRSGCATR